MNRVRKRRVVRRIYGMKYSWKGHKNRNRHKNRMKRSGQARLVYVKDINCDILTTWRWARGNPSYLTLLCHTIDLEANHCRISQNIAVHALPAARDFVLELVSTLPVCSPDTRNFVSELEFRNRRYGFDFPRELDVVCKIWGTSSCTAFFVNYFNRQLVFKKEKLLRFNDL